MIMVHDFSVSAQVAAAEPQVPAAETNSADQPQSGAGYSPNYSGGDMTGPENFFEVRAFDTASGPATPTDTQSLVLRRGRLFRIHGSERFGSMCLSRAREEEVRPTSRPSNHRSTPPSHMCSGRGISLDGLMSASWPPRAGQFSFHLQ
jgi:hypothetical protein